ncbi:MAG: Cro/Cl family transcriptional regulator [Caulobacter sp.]|nr:Cro/Cl family transcriptional regulator [Caulobacter sp.]
MPVIVTLDVMLARRKMKGKDLARAVGLSETQLSMLRSGKVRGVRFETLARLCAALDCKPGELMDYAFEPSDLTVATASSDEAEP